MNLHDIDWLRTGVLAYFSISALVFVWSFIADMAHDDTKPWRALYTALTNALFWPVVAFVYLLAVLI